MDFSSAKIRINRWLIALILGLSLGFSYEPPYIRYTYHEQFTNILGYTDTQLGLMISVYGTVALVFYIIGGVSADKFSCRSLIITSLLGSTLACIVMSTYPPFWVALGTQALFVVTTIGLLWSPVYKVGALLGEQREQGKILPMIASFEGVGAFITTLTCTMVYAAVGGDNNISGLRIVYWVYAAWGLLIAVCVYLFVPAKVLEGAEIEEKVEEEVHKESAMGILFETLKNPMTWIAAFIVLGSYICYSSLTYTQSFLCDIFGMDMTKASFFSILRNQVMKIVAGPLSVVLMSTAVLKSSPTRLCVVTGTLSIIGLIVTLALPANPAILPLVMGGAIILSLFALLGKAQNFACTGETGVDPRIFGTMSGVVSVVGYSSDTWLYVVCGRWQETLPPDQAYRNIFLLAISGCVLMIISGIILLINLKKRGIKAYA